jgi:DNA-nicking Smr family endonuclease
MDFGDILDKWDKQSAGKTGKKDSAVTENAASLANNEAAAAAEPKKVDPMEAWMRINGVYDKDSETEVSRNAAGERRRRLLRKRPDESLDLHGLTKEDAWAKLETFFQDSHSQGFEKVLIVHGKGNHSEGDAVLKQEVRKFIEACPFAGESGHGSAAEGGSGATWVLLK